jgi:hypothetical protein
MKEDSSTASIHARNRHPMCGRSYFSSRSASGDFRALAVSRRYRPETSNLHPIVRQSAIGGQLIARFHRAARRRLAVPEARWGRGPIKPPQREQASRRSKIRRRPAVPEARWGWGPIPDLLRWARGQSPRRESRRCVDRRFDAALSRKGLRCPSPPPSCAARPQVGTPRIARNFRRT